MSIVARTISNRRLEEKSAILKLLRSPLMPVVLGFVAEHFPPSTKARSAIEIYDLLDADLKMLRAEGLELPHDPQTYITDWVKAGWLVRRPGNAVTGETIEPSATTLNALDSVESWQHPHSAVSAARIHSIADSLENLSRESDPDINTRLAQRNSLIDRCYPKRAVRAQKIDAYRRVDHQHSQPGKRQRPRRHHCRPSSTALPRPGVGGLPGEHAHDGTLPIPPRLCAHPGLH